MTLTDTHSHLQDDAYKDDLDEVIERAKAADVAKIITMGDNIVNSRLATILSQKYEGVYAAVGLHPEAIGDATEDYLEELKKIAENKKVVAIGEIGLDYYWEKDVERRKTQQKIFVEQIRLAKELNLPVCVHDRDAHGDTLEILKRERKNLWGVCHCFSGSYETAAELFKLGVYIGVDGPLTFKNAAKLPEIIAKSPKDRVLIETDSPYLSPAPNRGKRNEPSYVLHIAEKLAEIWEISLEEVAEITTNNAKRLYNI